MSSTLKKILSLVMALTIAFGLFAPGMTVYATENGDEPAGNDVAGAAGENNIPAPDGDDPVQPLDEDPVQPLDEDPAGPFTVTYTDGVEDEEIFADQTYTVDAGAATPAFVGTPTRTNWNFTGWSPDVAETVTGSVTYTAQWEKATNNKPTKKITATDVNKMSIRAYALGTEILSSVGQTSSAVPTIKAAGVAYEIGAIEGNDVDGYTTSVTFHFKSGDKFESAANTTFNTNKNFLAVSGWQETFVGNWTYCFTEDRPADQVLTLAWKETVNPITGKKTGSWTIPGSLNPTNLTSAVANYIKVNLEIKETVTYTAGVDDGSAFNNQVFTTRRGAATPAFSGTPTRVGYTFTGWTPEVAKTVTESATYTAQWNVNTWTVSFDSNGGDKVDPITVTYGTKYGNLPSAGYIDGFQNGGWYLVDEDGKVTETKIDKRTAVTTDRNHVLFQNRSIKAPSVKVTLTTTSPDIGDNYGYYWPADSRRVLTVSFVREYNGEMLVYTYQWYKDGVAIEGATEPVLTLDGNVSDSGEYKCVVTARKADGCTVVTTNESAETALTTKVTIRKMANTLYQDFNDGTETPYVYSSYTNGTEISVKTPTQPLVREGYTFSGNWNTAPDGSGTNYRAGQTYTFTEDTGNGGVKAYLYAQWTANTYTVTLDPNGGEVDPASVTVTYNAPIGKLPTPTREGHTFAGWVDADGKKVTAETVYTTAGDSTLTAQWTVNIYTITLNANGGEVSPKSFTVAYGEPIGKLPIPTYGDNLFCGWVDQYGNVVTTKTIVTGDMKLLAGWKIPSETPATGDTTPLMALMFSMLVCACGVTALVVVRKKKEM